MRLLRRWNLRNGLVIEVFDESFRYYANYHNVKLLIKSIVPLKEEYIFNFKSSPYYEKISAMLLPKREYIREIVKVGVKEDMLERTKEEILGNFEKNVLSYMEREDFPEKFAKREFEKLEKSLFIEEKKLETEDES